MLYDHKYGKNSDLPEVRVNNKEEQLKSDLTKIKNTPAPDIDFLLPIWARLYTLRLKDDKATIDETKIVTQYCTAAFKIFLEKALGNFDNANDANKNEIFEKVVNIINNFGSVFYKDKPLLENYELLPNNSIALIATANDFKNNGIKESEKFEFIESLKTSLTPDIEPNTLNDEKEEKLAKSDNSATKSTYTILT